MSAGRRVIADGASGWQKYNNTYANLFLSRRPDFATGLSESRAGTTGQVVPVRMECPSPLEIWILQLIGWDACETSVSVLCSPRIQYLYPYILLRAMNVHRHIVSSCSVYGGLYLVYQKLRFLLLLFFFLKLRMIYIREEGLSMYRHHTWMESR